MAKDSKKVNIITVYFNQFVSQVQWGELGQLLENLDTTWRELGHRLVIDFFNPEQ